MPDRQNRHDKPAFKGPRPFWSGTIAFGLVNLPVGLYAAHHARQIALRQVDEDGTPLARRFFAESGRKPLKNTQLERGVEIAEDRYAVVEEEEIEDAALAHRREIELSRFVALDELDPLYFRRAYFLVPDKGALKPYRLLAQAMEKTKRAGVATLVMRGREVLVAIIAEGGILRAEALRFVDELRTPADIGLSEPGEPDAKSEKRLAQAIDRLSARTLDPDELIDPHMQALAKRIRRKQRRHEDIIPAEGDDVEAADDDEEASAEVIDLMQVLKRSLKRGRVEDTARLTRSQEAGGKKSDEPSRKRGAASSKSAKASTHDAKRAKKGASTGSSQRKTTANGSSSQKRSADSRAGSRQALYERAQELDIPGRSRMSKSELAEAIGQRE
ncbi:non-homologous end joining protein Ku [Salinicola rhizosphaerae]|uniref:Non-homologous end joining protein Ku n=1 Tax=Salinicola rhizosphaerae TaxID=1443141 RepID=A0ABQ3EDA9_9GAMM|nr:Ku protein [Salinicola rhizosphaerae]GHB34134.1 non-homologous end joining protein Ku [Salinicola rhizosphaerae]